MKGTWHFVDADGKEASGKFQGSKQELRTRAPPVPIPVGSTRYAFTT
jgi:hypothetical protein